MNNPVMTKDEFEQSYADYKGVTVEWLHEQGQYAAPCNCNLELCAGWEMTQRDPAEYNRLITTRLQREDVLLLLRIEAWLMLMYLSIGTASEDRVQCSDVLDLISLRVRLRELIDIAATPVEERVKEYVAG